MYKILEARIEFKNGHPYKIMVLVEMSKGDVRAIFASTIPRSGYMSIPPEAKVNDELLQDVAGYGMQVADKDDIFRDWEKKYYR